MCRDVRKYVWIPELYPIHQQIDELPYHIYSIYGILVYIWLECMANACR